MNLLSPRTLVSLFAVSLLACGSADDSEGSGGAKGSTTTGSANGGSGGAAPEVYPASHPDSPRVITLGGPVMKSQKVVGVFFTNDDPAVVSEIEAFLPQLGQSAYWATAGAEYGVGPATALPPIDLDEAAPANISGKDIETWLVGKLNADDPAFPPADGETVYTIYYPASTTIHAGGASCKDFGAYHDNTKLDAAHGNQAVVYAVIPTCNYHGLPTLDDVTAGTSHELLEAATDPVPEIHPAFGAIDNPHAYWEFLFGSEIGDLCADSPDAYQKYADLDFTVQRIWSNASALAGHDPCVPTIPGRVYFNAVPELDDELPISVPGEGKLMMKGVKIALQETKTITVDLFSDGAMDEPWQVKVMDGNHLIGGPTELDVKLDKTEGKNGDKLTLTIKAIKKDPYGFSTFALVSTQNKRSNLWLGMVAQ